jgi:hypothetical protein
MTLGMNVPRRLLDHPTAKTHLFGKSNSPQRVVSFDIEGVHGSDESVNVCYSLRSFAFRLAAAAAAAAAAVAAAAAAAPISVWRVTSLERLHAVTCSSRQAMNGGFTTQASLSASVRRGLGHATDDSLKLIAFSFFNFQSRVRRLTALRLRGGLRVAPGLQGALIV